MTLICRHSALNIKIPNLPKNNVYNFKYKTGVENIANKPFLPLKQSSLYFCWHFFLTLHLQVTNSYHKLICFYNISPQNYII